MLKQAVLKIKEEIEKIFKEKNIMKKDSLVFSCGSGVAACVVGAAYENLNNIDNYNVFDGSWTEWATKIISKIHNIYIILSNIFFN